MKIDIVIKDVSVEVAQQIFALVGDSAKVEEKPVAPVERFNCPHCDRKFVSQNSVNSHQKYCKEKPVATEPEEKAAVEKPVEKPVEKKERKRRVVSAKPPKKKESKPAFVAPSKADLNRTVATLVINNGHDITSTASVVHHICDGLKSKHGASDKLTKYAQKLDKLVTERLIKIESFLGAGQCMGMSLPDGYQIAVFADHGSLKLATLMAVL